MLGKQPAVECFLAIADLLLFPSAGESFGLAALEAMACETPVVGYRAGGLPEVVADGETGLLCPLGDTRALGDAALRILGDPELQQSMGRAARKRAVDLFAADNIVPRYEQIYRSMLERSAV
jgi:glycosyltransferase involved in cell wall biosynthesis